MSEQIKKCPICDESYTYGDFAQGLPWIIKYESAGEGGVSTVSEYGFCKSSVWRT